ncbi:MAG: RNA ligase partner protein [Patescibacteria group bacterium]|nr:RNA ligase partner protein [Patescibacteria group bacterium]
MEKFVLDTNLFFNFQSGIGLGKNPEELIKNLSQIIKKLKNKALFFMPPKAVDEFLSFFENKEESFVKKFLSLLLIKSPEIDKISFSARVFYKLINEIRQRSYRGLNIGEEEIEKAGKLMLGLGKLEKKEFQMKIGEIIKNFRDRYRKATRAGFLDSLTDLEMIVLAKEQDGYLVSSDEGVLIWGRIFGVKELAPSFFEEKLRLLLQE